MIRSTLAAAALLLAAPAFAQSFYPTMFGLRFCELRRMGVDKQQAVKLAMDETWSNSREQRFVTIDGKRKDLDVADATNFITNTCPELAK